MKVGILFLLAIIMITPTMTKSVYNVAIGNSFTFDVVKSSWDLSYSTDSSTGKGFQFEEVKYAEKTQFTVLVTDASTSVVHWNMSISSVTLEGSNDGCDMMIAFGDYLFYPLLLGDFSSGWNQTKVDLGPLLFPVFFVDVSSFSGFFYRMSNDTYVSTTFSTDVWVVTDVSGSFDNTSAIAVFEWHFDMTFTHVASGHNYGGTYTFIYAFDKTTGALKGYYMNINFSGQMDFTAVTAKLEQRVEQVGYNLPGVGFIPGFEWFMVIPAFALLVGLPIIIKRRK